MKETDFRNRAARLREAIENSPLRMSEIADTMGVARTSTLNWKRKGNISLDNLKGFSELTGYRFWWLAFGEGPKTYTETGAEKPEPPLLNVSKASPEHTQLAECMAHLTKAGVLTSSMAAGLTETLIAFAASRKGN